MLEFLTANNQGLTFVSLLFPFQEGTCIVVILSPLPFNIKGWEHIPPSLKILSSPDQVKPDLES